LTYKILSPAIEHSEGKVLLNDVKSIEGDRSHTTETSGYCSFYLYIHKFTVTTRLFTFFVAAFGLETQNWKCLEHCHRSAICCKEAQFFIHFLVYKACD
jgi:hypothetical protein